MGRLRRRFVIIVGLLALVLGAAWLTVTSSWFLSGRIAGVLSEKLGGDVRVGHTRYAGGGIVELRDVDVFVTTMSGPAAHVLSIGHAAVRVDRSKLLGGDVRLHYVELDDVHIRMSESQREPGTFNVFALQPSSSFGDESTVSRVAIISAIVEMGSHDGGRYTMSGTRELEGEMKPSKRGAGWYDFSLHDDDRSIRVAGQWNVRTKKSSGSITGSFPLDESTYGLVPLEARAWWTALELGGVVTSKSIDWNADLQLTAELEVEDVTMTLPFETDNLWARYREGRVEPSQGRPRMHLSRGTIRIEDDRLILDDLLGTLGSTDEDAFLVSVPYGVHFEAGPLPAIDWTGEWLDEVLATVPYEATLDIEDFSLDRDAQPSGDAPAMELPLAVAQVLARFELTGWALDTTVTVARDRPGELRSSGHAEIRHAVGQYDKFRYPLHDIEAVLDFANDRLDITRLVGRGAGDAIVELGGWIAPPTAEGAVAVTLDATDVPLDAAFRAALQDSEQRIFDALFDKASWSAFEEAGLVPDADAIAAARARLEETDDPVERRRLQRLVDAGPFELGGQIDVELEITRPLGADRRTSTSGSIHVDEATVVYEAFPYPVRTTNSDLLWQPDGVHLVATDDAPGPTFVTPAGGRGWISGDLRIDRDEDRIGVRPEIKISVAEDRTNELMLTAIPADSEGEISSSRTVEVLRALALEGDVAFEGDIGSDENDRVVYDFEVTLSDGRAAPGQALVEALQLPEAIWPDGFGVEGLGGRLRLSRDRIELVDFVGRHDGGDMRLGATVTLEGDTATQFDASITGVPVDRYLVGLQPEGSRSALEAWWGQTQPQGEFDVRVVVDTRTSDDPTIIVRPIELALDIEGAPVTLRHEAGEVTLRGPELTPGGLSMSAWIGDQQHGTVSFAGAGDLGSADAPLEVTGAWRDARFESPITRMLVRRAGGDELLERFASFDAVGGFDLDFTMTTGEDGGAAASIAPADLNMLLAGARVAMRFDEGSVVRVHEGAVALERLAGELDGGGLFDVAGAVELGDVLDVNVVVNYDGSIRAEPLQPFLPDVVVDAFDRIDFSDGGATRVEQCAINVRHWTDSRGEPAWSTEVRGDLVVNGASLVAGTAFDDIHGRFDVFVRAGMDVTETLEIRADVGRVIIDGVHFTDAHAFMYRDESRDYMVVPDGSAQVHGGMVTVDGLYGLKPGQDFMTNLTLAGVALDPLLMDLRRDAIDEQGPPTMRASGDVFASIQLAGYRNDTASRRGRGVVRIKDGRIESVPLALQLIQAAEFTPPASVIEAASVEARFFLVGERVIFATQERVGERDVHGIAFDSSGLALEGWGSMDYTTTDVELIFKSRSKVPIVGEVVAGLRGALVGIRVRGTLAEPEAGLVSPIPSEEHATSARPVRLDIKHTADGGTTP